MPRFLSSSQLGAVIADGVYALKVTKATEKVSERGNPIIVMTLCLPDGRSLGCVLTFVEAARPVINAFCESANLQRPPGEGVEVELTAAHCRGRYLYATIINDVSDPVPHISRFVSREQALIKNPDLAQINLQQQPAVVLPVVRRTDNAVPVRLPNPKPTRTNPPF
jgi:hypothetical protein